MSIFEFFEWETTPFVGLAFLITVILFALLEHLVLSFAKISRNKIRFLQTLYINIASAGAVITAIILPTAVIYLCWYAGFESYVALALLGQVPGILLWASELNNIFHGVAITTFWIPVMLLSARVTGSYLINVRGAVLTGYVLVTSVLFLLIFYWIKAWVMYFAVDSGYLPPQPKFIY